jgi:hypothetical protein
MGRGSSIAREHEAQKQKRFRRGCEDKEAEIALAAETDIHTGKTAAYDKERKDGKAVREQAEKPVAEVNNR